VIDQELQSISDEKHAVKTVLCPHDTLQVVLQDVKNFWKQAMNLVFNKRIQIFIRDLRNWCYCNIIVWEGVIIDQACEELIHELHVVGLLVFQLLRFLFKLLNFFTVLAILVLVVGVVEIVEHDAHQGV
jgi:hypothetical protein